MKNKENKQAKFGVILQNFLDSVKINYQNIALFAFIICMANSCIKPEEEIFWDIKNHAPMLVVDGAVTNEYKNQSIKLSLSSTYFSKDEPAPVHGAVVSIREGNNNYILTESPDKNGWYISDKPFAGETGKTYHLSVSLLENVNGQKNYYSSSTMPEGLDIDSIDCQIYALPNAMNDQGDVKEKDSTVLVVVFFGQEPEKSGNYYLAKISRNSKSLVSNIKDYPFIDDSERNGQYTNLITCVKNVASLDTITFNLMSINKDYYKYIDAISKIDQTGNIYSPQGPPANAMGNVNGALGFFIATYVSTAESLAIDMR